jgi:DNA polymerase-3 subunit alpha
MAALLTFEMGSTEKVVEYIEECKRIPLPDGRSGIKVLPPDVNISDKDFTPIYIESENGKGKRKVVTIDGVIRFGLMAVRGVGEKAVENVIAERTKKGPYTSLYDFCERIDLRQVTKATTEALVKCGAFSSLGGRRAQLLHVLDKAVDMAQQAQQDKRAGQMNFFGGGESTTASVASTMGSALPDVEELPDADLLKFEKELLGFYITSHPLTEHQSALEHFATSTSAEAKNCSEGTEVMVGGMISRLKKVITKNGRSAGMPMGIITLEDLEGSIDGTMFAETFAEITQRYPNVVAVESICFVRGKVDKKREMPSLLINEILPVSEAASRLTTSVGIKLDPVRHTPEIASQLEDAIGRHKGGVEVFLQVQTGPESRVTMKLNKERAVKPTRELVDDLELLLGTGSVQLCGAGTKRRKKQQQQQLFRQADATEEPVSEASTPEPLIDPVEMEMEEV